MKHPFIWGLSLYVLALVMLAALVLASGCAAGESCDPDEPGEVCEVGAGS